MEDDEKRGIARGGGAAYKGTGFKGFTSGEFDLSGDTSGTYGFDDSDSFSLSGNVSATGPSGGSAQTVIFWR